MSPQEGNGKSREIGELSVNVQWLQKELDEIKDLVRDMREIHYIQVRACDKKFMFLWGKVAGLAACVSIFIVAIGWVVRFVK